MDTDKIMPLKAPELGKSVTDIPPEHRMVNIVQQSGLETTKARHIMEQFERFFGVADEWELEAKALIVTDETQTEDMARARQGRLFLKNTRIDIEKTRKELKERALREGKAIDGIANVLKGIIVPIEEYLDRQENFVRIRKEEKAKELFDAWVAEEDAKKAAAEKAAAEAEVARQKAIIEENKRLKEEVDKKDAEYESERKKQEAVLAEARRIAAEELAEERNKQEAAQKIRDAELAEERKQRQKELDAAKAEQAERDAELQTIQKEMDREREKAVDAVAAAEAREEQRNAEIKELEEENARLESEMTNVECPFCHQTFEVSI